LQVFQVKVEVQERMKLKRSIRSAAIILCLTAWLFSMAYPALAGQGCGSNWLGSDVNDKDFWVSQNQNKGVSSPGMSASANTVGTANAGTAAARTANIGSVNGGQSSLIQDLKPDKSGPQMAGASITWTANATDAQKALLYKFLLKGPSTGNQVVEKTGWTEDNSWTWNTNASDLGESQVEVRVRSDKYLGSDANGFEESKSAKYTITTKDIEEVTPPAPVESNPHPKSRTADSLSTKSKPRLAPDERARAPAVNSNGPNMSMPDPTPKTLVKAEDTTIEESNGEEAATATESEFPEAEAPFESESSEPGALDMGGKWTIKFPGLGSSLELVLIQTGERVMGSGTLSEDKTKIPVTASGSVSRNRIELDAKTVVGDYVNKIDKSYNIKLAKSGDGSFSGSYEAYEGEKFKGEGNATAIRPGL
jgi:hypothetical protein